MTRGERHRPSRTPRPVFRGFHASASTQWCTGGARRTATESVIWPVFRAFRGGQGGVEPADPRSCGPANSVAAALSPGNADLQRPLFPTVALGCSARVHHHGAPMILIPFIIWCSHTRARRSSSIDRRVNGACRPHTPPAGSVKMIEAGVSGPGATGIDGHLPRAGWHTQAAGDTHGPGRDRGGPGRSPNHRSRRGGGQERVEVTFASEDG